MWEEPVVLEDDAEAPRPRFDEHRARGVVEDATGDRQASGTELLQSGDGSQQRRLPGAVRTEHGDDLAGRCPQRHVEQELATPYSAGQLDGALERDRHVAPAVRSQRSRSPPRTSSATPISGRLSAGASSGWVWNSVSTSVGRVRVTPGTLPPKSSVAPNSPSARAQQSTA